MKKASKRKFLKNYGIGYSCIKNIFNRIGLNNRLNSLNCKYAQMNKLSRIIKVYTLNNTLKSNINNNIEFYKKLRNYKGNRHLRKYPVRGQRTHTNARTIKFLKKNN
jgi:small subunit ribosomal protein S13